jgi:hypothetical protein
VKLQAEQVQEDEVSLEAICEVFQQEYVANSLLYKMLDIRKETHVSPLHEHRRRRDSLSPPNLPFVRCSHLRVRVPAHLFAAISPILEEYELCLEKH